MILRNRNKRKNHIEVGAGTRALYSNYCKTLRIYSTTIFVYLFIRSPRFRIIYCKKRIIWPRNRILVNRFLWEPVTKFKWMYSTKLYLCKLVHFRSTPFRWDRSTLLLNILLWESVKNVCINILNKIMPMQTCAFSIYVHWVGQT